jgi:hypothetical protein
VPEFQQFRGIISRNEVCMSLLIMSEREFRLFETGRLGSTPARILMFGFALAVPIGAGLVALQWTLSASLAQAWQTMGLAALAISAFLFALFSVGPFFEYWRYRRTRALPAAVRGFDIEPLTEAGYREILAAERGRGLGVAMDERRQRDWERIRARGPLPFAMIGVAAGLLAWSGMAVIFLLMPGARHPAGDAWEDLGWLLAAFPILLAAAMIGIWFFADWSYHRGKARTSA